MLSWDLASAEEILSDLEATLATKNGTAPAGVNEARKVQCKKSEYHGFHPENEACPMCDPEPPTSPGGWHWYNGQYSFDGNGG